MPISSPIIGAATGELFLLIPPTLPLVLHTIRPRLATLLQPPSPYLAYHIPQSAPLLHSTSPAVVRSRRRFRALLRRFRPGRGRVASGVLLPCALQGKIKVVPCLSTAKVIDLSVTTSPGVVGSVHPPLLSLRHENSD